MKVYGYQQVVRIRRNNRRVGRGSCRKQTGLYPAMVQCSKIFTNNKLLEFIS